LRQYKPGGKIALIPLASTHPLPCFADFEALARAAGFDDVLERRWAPGTAIETHTHGFAVEALVAEGEMWLTCGDETQHLRPGDRYTLNANVPHNERYGAAGATYWVARRAAR
jgi:mannose-6-phosphate isomerase-like protein (cupin superfamily)